jgi:ATP-dependent Clp protease ATP-binding subunit ClpA
MPATPISLDNLIAFVMSLHADAAPLDNLADAVKVASALDEQSDALIGYFVDQARRSGAPWSEIGASMGVTKQAVQKRFVGRADESDLLDQDQMFSRFTARARTVVGAARRVAALAEAPATDVKHLAVALLAEPDGIAALVIHGAGVSDQRLADALGIAALIGGPTPAPPRGEVPFSTEAKLALRGALRAALRLGHNYIGTEHLLLGIVETGGSAADTLATLGLTAEVAEAGVSEQLTILVQEKDAD